MKISKGKVRLKAGETRLGGFVVADRGGMVRVRDISGSVSFSVSKSLPKGMLLDSMLRGGLEGLRGVIAVTWNFLSTVPDMEFLQGVSRLCVECMERHPDVYGASPASGEEDHAEALSGLMADEAARGEFARASERMEDGR